ncbi:MAG: hypothetical protein V4736_04330 [Bdellovibrionota bacterium]
MKFTMILTSILLVSTLSQAKEPKRKVSNAEGPATASCSYILDGEAYVGKDDGKLVLNDRTYRCETVMIGNSERNLCKLKGNRSKNFDVVVAFDGAENDFYVFPGVDTPQDILCHSVATEKKKKK